MKRLIPAVVLACFAATAFAEGGDTKVAEHDYKVVMPAAWKALPDIANSAKNSVLGASTDIDGGAIAYGDTSSGMFAMTIWVTSKKKVGAVRAELTDFHDGIKSSLAGSGIAIDKYEVSETGTRVSSVIEGSAAKLKLRAISVGMVDKDGHLRGWSTQCVYAVTAAKTAGPLCDAVLASFAVTFPDADARPLEKKK